MTLNNNISLYMLNMAIVGVNFVIIQNLEKFCLKQIDNKLNFTVRELKKFKPGT